ncbi:MAG TPA: protein kinase, partial [Thermoanaerobaculia bacterium]
EIVAPIGAGGMGEVYKARDTRLDRSVAVKILPAEFASNSQLKARFEREAKTISQLSHPHICTLYDVGHQDGVEYLVMELLEGETLADRLARGPLTPGETLERGVEIAGALDRAHRKGIVHRDLKPSNVMLTASGVKLLDFGLAKALASEGPLDGLTAAPTAARDVTREGAIVGTLSYMAPEQLEGKPADARTDLFALGALLYEMAAGRKAFSGTSQASVISAILTSEPPSLASTPAAHPPGLDRIIRACLAKKPDERWQCAGDVRLELVWIARSSETPAALPPAQARSLRWWRGAAIAGLLASVALAIILARRSPTSTPEILRFAIQSPPGTRFVWNRLQNLFAVSPDGRRVVFAARRTDGRDSLWIRSLGEASAVPLSGTEGASAPFWSPDSRFVAFFSDGKLKKIDLSGGPPITLCDAPSGFPSGTWGSRHSILFADGAGRFVSQVEEGGGGPRIVLKPEVSRQEATVGWPDFLPDGRHFLYLGRSGAEKQTYVRIASVDGGATEPVAKNCSRAQCAPGDSAGGPAYLLYARDGSLIAQPFDLRRSRLVGNPVPTGLGIWQHVLIGTGPFSASANGVLASRGSEGPARLVWLDRAGRETGTLESPAGFDSVSLSRDSQKVLVTKISPRTGIHEIWLGDVSRSVLTKLELGDDEYLPPVWSPDGNRAATAVGSLRHPPVLSMFSVRAARSPEPILPAGVIQYAESWSPDGRFLLYAIRSGGDAGLWVVNAEGERKPRLLLTGVFDRSLQAQFSPDGRWVAYCSAESGRSEIFVTSLADAGERVRVSASGGSRPRWRREGGEI